MIIFLGPKQINNHKSDQLEKLFPHLPPTFRINHQEGIRLQL